MDEIDRALSEMPPSVRVRVRDSMAFESLCRYWLDQANNPWRAIKFDEHMRSYDAYRQAKYEDRLTAEMEARTRADAHDREERLLAERKAYAAKVALETGKPHQVRLSINELGRMIYNDNPSGERNRRKRRR